MGDIIAATLLILLVLALPVSFIYEVVRSGKEWDKKKAKDEAWLISEMMKPKALIAFVIQNGETKKTAHYLPWQTTPGSDWNIRKTSVESAKIALKNAYEAGFFMDDAGVTYPACNIVNATIQEEAV